MAKTKFKDPNGRHIRVYCSLLDSPAYRALSVAAKALFIDLRSYLNGSNNGNLSATLGDLRHKGWRAPATLSKAHYELRALGFLAVTRAGGLAMGTRVCTLYRFTDLEVFDQPKVHVQAVKATHDYLRFASLREADAARHSGVDALRAEGRKKQSPRKERPVQNVNRINTQSIPMNHFIGTENEHGNALSVHNLNKQECEKKRRKPHRYWRYEPPSALDCLYLSLFAF